MTSTTQPSAHDPLPPKMSLEELEVLFEQHYGKTLDEAMTEVRIEEKLRALFRPEG